MATQIDNVIVHKLLKEAHARVADLDLRAQPVLVSPVVQRLVDTIFESYAKKPSKGFGRFEDDANEYPVQRHLREHLGGEVEFVEHSRRLMGHLQTRAAAEPLATGGYVLIALTRDGAQRYLLIAVVTDSLGAAITEALDVVESVRLELNQLRVAGRVDLGRWLDGEDRYVSFLKGRGDIAEYFKLFLGCNDVHIPKVESKKLVEGLRQFAAVKQLTPEAKDALLAAAHAYLSNLSKTGAPVQLGAMSNHLWPDEPEAMSNVLGGDALALNDGFVPDGRVLRTLLKLEGKSANWKLSFDRSALTRREIVYDPAHETLTLTNLPQSLKDEIVEELGNEAAGD